MANHSNKSWEQDFFLKILDIDDVPVDGVTTAPISSNWAFDHENNTSAHGGPYDNYASWTIEADDLNTGAVSTSQTVHFTSPLDSIDTVWDDLNNELELEINFGGSGTAVTAAHSDHDHSGVYNNYIHPNHSGDVTSVADGATTLTKAAITSKTDIGADVTVLDEMIIWDQSLDVIRKFHIDDMVSYFDTNLSFNDYTHPSDGVDPGIALTGAFVFSDIDVNAAGHVTGSATRQLTPSDISAEATANKGAASGYCPLEADSKISVTYLPDTVLGGVDYQGTWNATTNAPTITGGSGTKGDYYVVSVAGSTDIDGITDWKINDWIIYNGTAWEKVDNTDSVVSVNSLTGAVSIGVAELDDVTLTSLAAGEILVASSGSAWINQTLAEAGIQPSGTYNTIIGVDTDLDTSGAQVIDTITMTDGVITADITTRNLTPADISALAVADIDDVAVNGVTDAPISSNWAYDHENNPSAHGTNPWSIKTTAYTAVDGDQLVADSTSGAFTITLPLTPTANNVVRIKTTVSYTNNITVARNGANILSAADDYIIDGDYIDITFLYVNATIGWLI